MNINRQMKFRTAATVVLLAIIALVYMLGGKVSASISGGKLTARALLFSESVALTDIQSAELVTDFDPGLRKFGMELLSGRSGTYENESLGEYRLAAAKDAPVYLVVRHCGGTLVIGLNDEAQARALYKRIGAGK